MKIWLMFLILEDGGVANRYSLEFSTKRSCERELKRVIKNSYNSFNHGYCLEVFARKE